MTTATVSSKGRIMVPANVRQALHVNADDRADVDKMEQDRFLFLAVNRSVTNLRGMFGKAQKVVSIDDMNAAIAQRGCTIQ